MRLAFLSRIGLVNEVRALKVFLKDMAFLVQKKITAVTVRQAGFDKYIFKIGYYGGEARIRSRSILESQGFDQTKAFIFIAAAEFNNFKSLRLNNLFYPFYRKIALKHLIAPKKF